MIQAGQKFSFGVTYDRPDLLFVAAKIFDNSGVSPVLLATVPMTNFWGNSYQGSYTTNFVIPLLIQYGSYTDGTYTVFDDNESQGDREEQVVQSGGGSAGNTPCMIIGLIQSNPILIGLISNSQLIGIINC